MIPNFGFFPVVGNPFAITISMILVILRMNVPLDLSNHQYIEKVLAILAKNANKIIQQTAAAVFIMFR
jgi:hypothetical protein